MVLTVESASLGNGPELRLKRPFLYSSAQWWTRGSVFAAKDAFGSVCIVVMSCQKQREEASGVGCNATIAVDEDDDDEDI